MSRSEKKNYLSAIAQWRDLLDCDFLHFGFFQVYSYIIAGNNTYKDYVEIFKYSCVEVINWKENKEVGTIYFEIRIPMKKPKIFLEFFCERFQNKILYLDLTILFWKKTKIYLESFLFHQKTSALGLLSKYYPELRYNLDNAWRYLLKKVSKIYMKLR